VSVKMMARAWELDLPQNEKFIRLAFADHADDDGLAYPSIGRIAWKSGYSIRQVQTIVGELKERGILVATDGAKGGRSVATAYRICPEKGAKIAPFRPLKRVRFATERVKPTAQKGEVATAYESSVTVIEPAAALNPLWSYLRIRPCGTREFRECLELAWLSLNGKSPLEGLGDAIDAFERVHGKRAWGKSAAPIFQALKRLRGEKRVSPSRSPEADPIRAKPEEIPEWQVPTR